MANKGEIMGFIENLFIFIGRVCISVPYLWASYALIKNWNESKKFLIEKKIPKAEIVLPVSILLKTLGALLILIGWQAHFGALLLLAVTVPATLKFHPFWNFQGDNFIIELTYFMKHVVVVGGLILLLAIGAGSFSA